MDDVAKSRSELIEELSKLQASRNRIRSAGYGLLREQTHFELLLQASPAAIISFHPDTTVRSFSAGAEQLFGYDELDILNKSAEFLIPESAVSADGLMDYLGRRAKTAISQWESPLIGRHADGSRLQLMADVSEVGGEAGFQQMLVVFHDITRFKRAEQEYICYRNNLEHLVAELKDELRVTKEQIRPVFPEEGV